MKYIYSFSEGSTEMKELLGGKGANLAEMTNLGFPVPPGFTITTEVCNLFLKNNEYPENFDQQLNEKLIELEKKLSKKLGDNENSLLVSVRSGAKFSMPGMMDTILNLGLNDETIQGLIAKTKNERFCYDAYRRFINMFGDVVLGVDHENFEEAITALKEKEGVKLDTELTAENLKELVEIYKNIIKNATGKDFPAQPREQLKLAIEAVFGSWKSERALCYRRLHNIPDNLGTAVNIQSMVFGNMGENSGTGVAFTRNPSTGENVFYGEYLFNAQGEDVVAGIRTPLPLKSLEEKMPKIYAELAANRDRLEKHYRDMQDMEFTIEQGKLYMLQTRVGKRTAAAALKIAVDMTKEGLISKEEAVLRIDPKQIVQLLHPSIDPKASKEVVAKGLPASPGAACGKIVFSADDALNWAEEGENVILVRKETTPEDIHGMNAAKGILTSTGGMTSHAAVVCRGMGKCCIAGCADCLINKKDRKMTIGDKIFREGDVITLNGTTGEVIIGQVPMREPEMTEDFKTLISWADEFRRLKIRANADIPRDARVAREFGAEGIGLCRTEHMFFESDRIDKVREMILANDYEGRTKALDKLLPLQIEDFKGIFTEMNGLPVTIRLLDPPLHEFMPESDKKIEALSKQMGITFGALKDAIVRLHEVNPMLGHRGCRLGLTYPEIYKMQVRAILIAANEVAKEGIKVLPEIEVPLIGDLNELKATKKDILEVIEELKDKINFPYKIGTMIELPRACLVANELATEAEFFSFGTNDLTQMTYGISRDDGGKFLPYYLENQIYLENPTETIDQIGVGNLMKLCVKLGREIKPDLEIGICGEHGGEPKSVMFCHEIGLNYVSCSPYRVPVARLAAAHVAILEAQKKTQEMDFQQKGTLKKRNKRLIAESFRDA